MQGNWCGLPSLTITQRIQETGIEGQHNAMAARMDLEWRGFYWELALQSCDVTGARVLGNESISEPSDTEECQDSALPQTWTWGLHWFSTLAVTMKISVPQDWSLTLQLPEFLASSRTHPPTFPQDHSSRRDVSQAEALEPLQKYLVKRKWMEAPPWTRAAWLRARRGRSLQFLYKLPVWSNSCNLSSSFFDVGN